MHSPGEISKLLVRIFNLYYLKTSTSSDYIYLKCAKNTSGVNNVLKYLTELRIAQSVSKLILEFEIAPLYLCNRLEIS